MKKFPDTKKGAIKALEDMSCFEIKEAKAIPDSQVDGVWLVVADTQLGKIAAVVYVNVPDFEVFDYEEAMSKYGRRFEDD